MKKNKIKSIVQIMRHGARTSTSVGRPEDHMLSQERKGLTPLGFFQLYCYGSELSEDEFFKNSFMPENDKNIKTDFNYSNVIGGVNIYTSEKNRVLESAHSLIKGILSKNIKIDSKLKFVEGAFAENTFNSKRFHPVNKYNDILKKFALYRDTQFETLNKDNRINLLPNKNIFDKTISTDHTIRLTNNYSKFEKDNSDNFITLLLPYFKKLFMQDLEKGCFDFNSNTLIDNNFFKDKRNHSLRVLKILTDFIRCNKFYEDIPIYQTEYKEFAQILKHFLINYYDSSSTIEEEINFFRLKTFFEELLKIVENQIPSYNIFINHNTAIRTFIKFMLCEEEYFSLRISKEVSDDDFFILCPKFAGTCTIKILEDNFMKLEVNGEDITSKVRKEIKSKSNGESLIDYYKFKNFLKDFIL